MGGSGSIRTLFEIRNPYGKWMLPKVIQLTVAFWSCFIAVTTRANHGRDTLLEYDLSKVDG